MHEYDEMLLRATNGDQEAIKEVKAELKTLEDFDKGLAGCSGSSVPTPNHEKICQILSNIVRIYEQK